MKPKFPWSIYTLGIKSRIGVDWLEVIALSHRLILNNIIMAVVILIMEQINLIIYLPLSMKSGNLIMIARVHHDSRDPTMGKGQNCKWHSPTLYKK